VVPHDSIPHRPHWTWIGGLDFGFSAGHPNGYLVIGEANRTLYALAEIDRERMLMAELADAIRDAEGPFGCETGPVRDADSAAAQERAELKQLGIRTRAADKSVMEGIRAVMKRLAVDGNGRPGLVVSDRCVNLIREFESYEWAKRGDKPRKENDHLMDALRYAVVGFDGAALSKPSPTPNAGKRTAWKDRGRLG
jgi:phage terminase large subunit